MATRIPYDFATAGDMEEVPSVSATDELSFQSGWSEAYEKSSDEAGYRYLSRDEHNYLWNVITSNIREWQQQTFPDWISDELDSGTPYAYDTGAIVRYTDGLNYISLVDSNTGEPSVSSDWELFDVATKEYVDGIIPAGHVAVFAMDSAPSGYLKANGAAVSRTTYADLYAAIGETFGSGDGSTTFNLPDLRGEFVRGYDDGRGVDSGRTFGSSQDFAIENITGTLQGGPAETPVFYGATGAFSRVAFSARGSNRLSEEGGSASGYDAYFDASSSVNTADETRPRNIALLYCIKY